MSFRIHIAMYIMIATIAAAMIQVYDVVGQRFTCIAKMPVV